MARCGVQGGGGNIRAPFMGMFSCLLVTPETLNISRLKTLMHVFDAIVFACLAGWVAFMGLSMYLLVPVA
jgi:hypothetical protein